MILPQRIWLTILKKKLNVNNEALDILPEPLNITKQLTDLDLEIEEHFSSFEISKDEVRMAISRPKKGKQSGPDNIIPEFFI